MTKQCAANGCIRPYYAKGHCELHWHRLRINGTLFRKPRCAQDPAERFWRRVERLSAAECWLWQGPPTNSGYGRFQIGGKGSLHWGAHRFAFNDTNGFLPEVVMHTCDNRICVNPAHLRAGTHKENTQDMIAKGRRPRIVAEGERNPGSKLNPESVRAIRALEGSGLSANKVSKQFGVGHKVILAVWRGITWKHVT